MRILVLLLTSFSLLSCVGGPISAQLPDFTENKKQAEAGNAGAQCRLGNMYAFGEGVPKDDAEAAKWYRKAADQGHAQAQNSLGLMYAFGEGVPKDDAEAVKWFRKAADQGIAQAQYNLGVMYYEGRGVPKDAVEAYAWFNLAAVSDENAHKFRDVLEKSLTPEQKTHAMRRSKELHKEIDAR